MPEAEEAWVVPEGEKATPLTRKEETDFFEAQFPGCEQVFTYELRILDRFGKETQAADPYSFLPLITPDDQYLFNEGNDWRTYNKLGAHLRNVNGVKGVDFAVWAPNAERVSVVGDFNVWDGRRH